jgi:hypothetical protein
LFLLTTTVSLEELWAWAKAMAERVVKTMEKRIMKVLDY